LAYRASFGRVQFLLAQNCFSQCCDTYIWLDPGRIPQSCACELKFSVKHSFSCPKGGFPSIHHNKIRDLTARLLTGVCHEVEIEPTLHIVTGKQFVFASSNTNDGVRLDITANGFGEVDVRKHVLM